MGVQFIFIFFVFGMTRACRDLITQRLFMFHAMSLSLSLSLCFSVERETNVACSIEQCTCSVVVSLFLLFGGSVDAYNLIQTSETVSLSSCYQYIYI